MNMKDEDEKSQKIQMIAFTTNEKSYNPNDIISNYLDNNSHFLIKKNQQMIAFSTVLPEQKKSTKIMMITLLDLEIEYEGINDVNCYIIVIDLQKDTSKDKYKEILAYMRKFCDSSKKIFLLGVKKDEEEKPIKITKEEIEDSINNLNLDYEYFELNMDNSIQVSDKIINIFNYGFNSSIYSKSGKNDNEGVSCLIY